MVFNIKSTVIIILLLGFTFFPFPQAICIRSSITIESSADTFVNSMYLQTKLPEKPHGYLWGMFAGNMYYSAENVFGATRTYLRFNLSSITPDFQIVSAILRLYLYDAPARAESFDVHIVYQDWDEDQLIWINQPDFSETSVDSSIIDSITDRWISWNITETTKAWHSNQYENYGVMIKINEERNATDELASFCPKENLKGPEFRPKLEVTVEGETEIPEMAFSIFPLILAFTLYLSFKAFKSINSARYNQVGT